MFLSFIYVVSYWDIHFFILMNSMLLYECTGLSILLPTGTWLFQVLAIIRLQWTFLYKAFSGHVFISLGQYLGMELLDHMVDRRNWQVFQEGYIILHSTTSNVWEIELLLGLPLLLSSLLPMCGIVSLFFISANPVDT